MRRGPIIPVLDPYKRDRRRARDTRYIHAPLDYTAVPSTGGIIDALALLCLDHVIA
jgi:hypothetical protein